MIKVKKYANQHFAGRSYSMFNENLSVELEYDKVGVGTPCFIFQVGGDYVLYVNFQAFNRSCSLCVVPLW